MSKFVSPAYKVILGGLGGDELFIGYDIYKFIKAVRPLLDNIPEKLQKYLLEPLSQLSFFMQQSTGHLASDEYRRGLQMLLSVGNLKKFYLILRNCWDYDSGFFKRIYHPDFPMEDIISIEKHFTSLFDKVNHQSAVDAVAYTEFHSKMVNDYLLVDDRMSMAHSVELRVPYLDKDLVEYMFSVPAALKMEGNTTKSLFRQAMRSYLPQDIIDKKKWGFTVNPYEQFKKDLKQVAEKILTEKYINQQGIFNYAYIKQILEYPANPKMRWHYNYLWIVLGIAIWEKMFILTDNFMNKNFNIEDYYNA